MVFIPLEFKKKYTTLLTIYTQQLEKEKNLQLYFYDNENEMTNRIGCSTGISEIIVRKLMSILKINLYSFFLKSLSDVPELSHFYTALKCDWFRSTCI